METVAMQLGGARNVIQCSRASSLGRFFLRADADSSSWLADAVRAASVISDAVLQLVPAVPGGGCFFLTFFNVMYRHILHQSSLLGGALQSDGGARAALLSYF